MSQALETPASEALPKTPRLLQPSGELSYALPSDSRAMRAVIKVIERLTGSKKIHRLYQRWRVEKYAQGAPFWDSALEMLGVELRLHGAPWPPLVATDEPRIIIANHPYGLLDGVAAALSFACRFLRNPGGNAEKPAIAQGCVGCPGGWGNHCHISGRGRINRA